MESVGAGACGIRIQSRDGGFVQHRVVYVAKFPEAVYVLHAFAKERADLAPQSAGGQGPLPRDDGGPRIPETEQGR